MKTLDRLRQLDVEAGLVERTAALLSWDQETCMPSAAIGERADQLAFLEALAHGKRTLPETGELLLSLGSVSENPEGDACLPEMDRAYLRILRRAWDRATKIPAGLVAEMARAASLSQAAWAKAKEQDDYGAFAPHLKKMIDYNRRIASCLDPGARAYDVLLDRFEEGETEASIAAVLGNLKQELLPLLDRIRGRPQLDDAFLRRPCPKAAQAALSARLLELLGFDTARGRLDTAAHPFSTTLGSSDVRITTRYEEDYFPSSMYGTIHECGHALYELGVDPAPEYRRTSLATASSMAIHESQSRLWENLVGRSRAFCETQLPEMSRSLSPVLDGVSTEAYYRGINRVEASLIRTDADEVSYSLHIILRFELEGALLSGDLSITDLPAAWNAGMKRLLGVEPASDAKGCLQDMHWAFGAIGYFPSYALGNLYAAQWWAAMGEQGLQPDQAVADGGFSRILDWLRQNVHKPGCMFRPAELVRRGSGRPLDPSLFVDYLKEKFAGVYGF
ncbi:MAG: carboxypeptidase M32 [Spirochaetota bacterium]